MTDMPTTAAQALAELADPDALREQALVLLRGLAGDTWTDHNTHDPGITLLESLCYALTDLGYRIDHPVADLMAEHDAPGAMPDPAARGLWTAAQMLAGGAVTADDLRRLVMDVPGVKNAWIEPVDAALARHDGAQGQLLPLVGEAAPSPNIAELRPQGLLAVRIEKSGLGEDIDGGTIVRRVARQLHGWRGLGQDVVQVEVLDTQRVALAATLDIAPDADPAAVLGDAILALADHLSPPVPFRSLAEMLARGRRVDQVFDGPLLQHGFLDAAEFAALARRTSVRLSDLVGVLMAVPGVRAVARIAFLADGRPSGDWLLAIDPRRTAALDLDGSQLRLERRQVRVDDAGVLAIARQRVEQVRRARAAAMDAAARSGERDLSLPAGRSRQVARYRSVQHHLPRAYGLGPEGLPASASPQRRAQAAQLQAYLLFFDQLLANQHAQLSGVSRLLAFDEPAQALATAAFALPVPDDDGRLGLDALRRGDAATHAQRLSALAADPLELGDPRAALLQRHRQADHLLARAGERLGPHAARADRLDDGAPPEAALLADKLALLRALPVLGRRRGAGADAMRAARDDDGADTQDAAASTVDGLSLRLAQAMGLGPAAGTAGEPLRVVEHILLRPLPEDAAQDGPLMLGTLSADPFSLQLSVALDAGAGRLADADFRRLVEQTLRDHLPVHLGLRVLWLASADLAALASAHDRWWALWCASRREAFGSDVPAAGAADAVALRRLPLRSARNRLIDRLGLGDTAPLTDVPLGGSGDGPIKVPHGGPARIALAYAELGVRYELRGPDGQALRGTGGQAVAPVTVEGADGPATLESPPVNEDITFRVLATKLGSAQPPRLLTQPVPVKVGLDTSLALDAPGLPWLDPLLPSPQPADARLVPWGSVVTVTVQGSQEGVSYALVLNGQVQPGARLGDLSALPLQTPPLVDDVVIAVQASKTFAGASGRSEDVELLDARLTVCVRANPGLGVQLRPKGVADGHASGLSLHVEGGQAEVRYAAWQRRVRDAEFVRGAAADDARLLRAVSGDAAMPLPAVPRPPVGEDDGPAPEGFTALPGAEASGDGRQAEVPLPPPLDDVVLCLSATKLHQPAGQGRAIASVVWLTQPALLLVRPDAEPALQPQWWRGRATQALVLQGGQPGVAYQPLLAPAADAPAGTPPTPLARPGYVHQRDIQQPGINKGVGQLALEIDCAIAADPPRRPVPGVDALDAQAPQPPRLDLAADLPAAGRIVWQAVKAQTGLQAPLRAGTPLFALPVAELDPAFPAPGQAAAIRLSASDPALSYRLMRMSDTGDATPLGEPVPGQGGELVLAVPAPSSDGWLALWVRAGAPVPGTLPLQAVLQLPLRLLPRTDLAVRAELDSVSAGQATTVWVTEPQPGVLYQLMAGDQALGDAVAGQGVALALPTGPIAQTTDFRLVATRADAPAARVSLATVVRVSVVAA